MNDAQTDKIIRALIIDDEPVACEFLNWMLEQDPDVKILGACRDGTTALTTIREKHPDLIFLDIQMPDVDGFALLRNLKDEERPYLIFVTAYDNYAIRAFEVQAIDYLLKPFNQKRFRKALIRAKERIFGQKQLSFLQSDSAQASANTHFNRYLQRLEIKASGRIYYIPVSEVSWIEAADQYADIHCAAASYLVRMSMDWLERHLDPNDFVRIHRSVIVHVNNVREVMFARRQLILNDGKKLKISRRRFTFLRKRIQS